MFVHVGFEEDFGLCFGAACFLEDLAPTHAGGVGESEGCLLAIGPHFAAGVVAEVVLDLGSACGVGKEGLKGVELLAAVLVHREYNWEYINYTPKYTPVRVN
jgi:hypothetical protein